METGKKGYNLAAIMLIGKDDVILNACPAYATDALVRRINVDRYDDREVIRTNLVESYEQLIEFGKKHLPDKFFLEDEYRKSLRNTIIREMIGNTLIHREFTSSYMANFVIEKNRTYTENANRAVKEGLITPDNLEPNPKNPLIAAFFRNIGFADQLGSGVRNLFKYSKFYSGKEPEFIEGDIFRIVVPLNDVYSYDYEEVPSSTTVSELPITADESILTEQQRLLLEYVHIHGNITSRKAEELLNIKQRRARDILKELAEKDILIKQGSYKSTSYILKVKN